MRMRPTRGHREPELVDVELLEADGAAPDPAAVLAEVRHGTYLHGMLPTETPPLSSEESATVHRDRVARRRRLVTVAALVALPILGLVGVGAVLEARADAERMAVLADSPGVLPRLDGPISEQWRVEAGWLAAELDGVLIVSTSTLDQVQAVDGESGEVLWTLGTPQGGETESLYCMPLVDTADTTRLDLRTGQVAEHLACVWRSSADPGAPAGSTPGMVTLVEPTTGTVVHSVESDGQVLTAELVRGGLVIASITTDGRLRVTRSTVEDWVVEWSYVSPEPLLGPDGVSIRGYGSADGVLQVEAQGVLAVSMITGEELEYSAWGQDRGLDLTVTVDLPDGARAEWTYTSYTDGSGRVVEPDGSERYPLPGPVPVVPVHDGTDPDVLLVSASESMQGLLALDAATGGELWSVQRREGQPVAQVDGVVVTSGLGSVEGLDVRDGTVRWEVETNSMISSYGLSDGRVVLVPGGEGLEPSLGAHLIADGSEQWRVPLPASTTNVHATSGGTILVSTDGWLIALG